ncbi:hypothetical protein [Dyella sp. C9]|uniref:hypothetical protein n=1 Tax=Dyella sp. C9 TaxID=2202154 RepID=UPI000DEF6C5B|nr:hypothetical protein [Dyella sp. C9]
MKPLPKPSTLPTLLAATLLILAGCASKPATRPVSASGTSAGAAAHGGAASTGTRSSAAKPTAGLPSSTGIPACDDYLSSYVACHRAAAIYAPDQIDAHYQDMRTSLLKDSQDPAIRPQLGARCTALAQQLRQALHGKSCAPASPAAPASAPTSR